MMNRKFRHKMADFESLDELSFSDLIAMRSEVIMLGSITSNPDEAKKYIDFHIKLNAEIWKRVNLYKKNKTNSRLRHKPMNTPELFNALRQMAGSLSQQQVDSVNAILSACTGHGVTDDRQVAYIIATAYHEARLRPVEEIGKGKGLPYGQKLDIGGGPGKRVPYTTPDQLFYGRGLTQLTWLSNYKAFGHLLDVDLVNHPELAMQTNYAAEIIVVGMQKGMFTGVNLQRFFHDGLTDEVDARTIINGHDQAVLIAGYYDKIYAGITA